MFEPEVFRKQMCCIEESTFTFHSLLYWYSLSLVRMNTKQLYP